MIIYEKNGGLLINFDNIINSETSDISLMKVDNEVEVKIGAADIADITPSSKSTVEEKEPEVKEPENSDSPKEEEDPEEEVKDEEEDPKEDPKE